MSTATEIMLRAQETQKRFDALLPRWNDALLLRWWGINCWLSHLQRAAASTRHQLTYTPPAGHQPETEGPCNTQSQPCR